jgi:hypothetical protein
LACDTTDGDCKTTCLSGSPDEQTADLCLNACGISYYECAAPCYG